MKGAFLALILWPLLGAAAPPRPGTVAFLRTCCEGAGDAQTDVYVARTDGTKPRAVTHLFNVSEVSWSPDRKWLAITRDQFNPVLFALRSTGGKLHRISTGTSDVYSPIWSSDGRLIAYSQGTLGRGSLWVSTIGGPAQRIASGTPVAWSPTQPRELAYQSTDGIHVADAARHTDRRLFGGNYNNGSIRWSPDGRRIVADAFSWPNHARPPTPGDLYVYSLTSGKRTDVSHTGGYDRDPAWSPDGRRIAWSTNHAIWLVNADGSGKRRVTSTTGKDTVVIEPTWSPDGRSIIFVRGIADSCQLYLVRIQAGTASPLFAPQDQPTGNSPCDREPIWFR